MAARRLVLWTRRAALAVLAAAALWLAGLGCFVGSSFVFGGDDAAATDGIVVLTGGRQRLEAGLALLAAGKARKLFISGVNQHVDREEILRLLGPAAERLACCIVLGHAAGTTFGNARETADWVGAEGYRSIRLVTSWYHLPRSLVEFHRAMPGVSITPHPVFPSHVAPEHWSGWHGAPLLVIGEYSKFLASVTRPLWNPLFPRVNPERQQGWVSNARSPQRTG